MTVRLLYFASVRDLLGMSEELLTLPPEILTVDALAHYVFRLHPELGPRLRSLRFACNESFSPPEHLLADGDTVALIPPVSGG